jgi:hypothetical protein
LGDAGARMSGNGIFSCCDVIEAENNKTQDLFFDVEMMGNYHQPHILLHAVTMPETTATGTYPLRVGIIGGGFAGLSLANYLQRVATETERPDLAPVVLESKPDNIPIVGTIQLPFGKELLELLDLLEGAMDAGVFPKPSNVTTVSREDYLDMLRLRVDIQIGCRVVDVVERMQGGSSTRFIVTEDGREFGPFDIVVLADGIFEAKSLRDNQSIDAKIGDCRWYSERLSLWDFGTSRIKCGADIAIRDGVELGKRLVEVFRFTGSREAERQRLFGEFAMPDSVTVLKRKRQKEMMTMLLLPLAFSILYRLLQDFDRI